MEKTNIAPENNVNETIESEVEKTEEKKSKAALIKKVLIIAIAILTLLVIILILVFLLKSSSKEETVEAPQVTLEEPVTTQEVEVNEPKEFKFDFNNLEPEKLNEQLALLTNKNLEIQRTEEFNNNSKDKVESESLFPKDEKEDKKEENIAINNNEQTIYKEDTKAIEIVEQKKDIEKAKPNVIPQIENTIVNEENTINNNDSSPFVKLINVAKIKGDLNKKYLDKAITVNPNILLCRDEINNIELYYGPFIDDELRDELLKKLLSKGFKEAYILEMLEDEFNKRCNY
ncbi:hypothetical protein [Aliarcobacter lanthieri]|uniref:hypothetical protein n=1 Tax=Aliarcobacter lanthieri TaxID=1355374 RepID=UPI00047A5A1A|nr:hypothetical protein [Aliarcobacter lanthieri]QKF59971.1 hypothetical protein ALANTH_1895 [Aliarcobacter lanthieri]